MSRFLLIIMIILSIYIFISLDNGGKNQVIDITKNIPTKVNTIAQTVESRINGK